MKVSLIPYAWNDGVPTFRDSQVMDLYARMEADGTAADSFHDGSVRCAADFLRCMKTGPSWLYVFADHHRGPVGIGWINNIRLKSASGHFCFFSSVWGQKDLPELGFWGVQRLLRMTGSDGQYLFDMFWGLLPVENHLAVKFVSRAGGHKLGVLPNGLWDAARGCSVDGMLYYFVREGGEYESVYQSGY